MSTKIRLKRMGAKKNPFYRIVVANSRSPRDGGFIEELGHYNPIDDRMLKVDEERTLNWLQNGAQPSDTVKSLLKKSGVWEKFTELKRQKRG